MRSRKAYGRDGRYTPAVTAEDLVEGFIKCPRPSCENVIFAGEKGSNILKYVLTISSNLLSFVYITRRSVERELPIAAASATGTEKIASMPIELPV